MDYPFEANNLTKRFGETAALDRIDLRIRVTRLDGEDLAGPPGEESAAVRARVVAARKRQLGFNESALHWDLVNTEKKRVTAHLKSGKALVIYENGRFSTF